MFGTLKRCWGVALVAAVVASMFAWSDSQSGTQGILKLKVRPCISNSWLSNADVEVSIQRPGTGEVDSAKGYTNGVGYIEFEFSDLEGGDQAHVTITPSGQDPDEGHAYTWVPPSAVLSVGFWDVSIYGDSLCSDGYYDEGNNIILALYE